MRVFCTELKRLLCCPFLLALWAVFLAFCIACLLEDLSPGRYRYNDIYPAVVGDAAAGAEALAYYRSYYAANAGQYDDLDILHIFAAKMQLYYPEVPQGSAYYRWAAGNYRALQTRVEQIRASGEGGMDFYPGEVYAVHARLSRLLSRSLLTSLVLAAMSLFYLMDYDRLNRTEGLVYATKTGRAVQLTKILAGTVFSLLSAAVLFGVPLAVFAAAVPMGGLWGTAVSAFPLTEPKMFFTYPYLTWTRMSVGMRLWAVLGLCTVLLLITLAVCAGIQLLVRNSYRAMLGTATAFLGMLVLPYAVPGGVCKSLSLMSPAVLWWSIGTWFIEADPARGPFFEATTAALWAALGAVALAAGWKHFQKAGIP